MVTKLPSDSTDFRVRVAAEKRQRMRQRLLAATLDACSGPGGPAAAVIDDIVGAAGVSRGAFYRHFASLDEAVTALVDSLVEEIVTAAQTTFPDVADAALGCALGTQLLLRRAAGDREWAGFVARTGLLLDAAPLRAVLERTIRHGASNGAFAIGPIELAVDAVAGILLAGIRRLHGNPAAGAAYILDLSIILLQALGVPPDTACRTAETAARRIGDPA